MGEYTYKYPRPALTADIAVFNSRNEILLIKRKNPPFQDCWALPGGFFDMEDEDIKATAVRELQEETHLVDVELSMVTVGSRKDRDPRGRTVTVLFSGILDHEQEAYADDDAKELKWWNIENLPPMAFDHGELLEEAIKMKKDH